MDILLQCVALIYLSLVSYVFLKQKKINKIENYVYNGIIILNFVELFFDIGYHLVNYYYPDTMISMVVTKLFICSSISWALGFASYVFVLSSSKNDGREATGAVKKYFIDRFMMVIICIILIDIIVFMLPLDILIFPEYVILMGPATFFMYGVIGSTTFINLFTLLKNRRSLIEKKYTIVWVFSVFLVIGLIIQMIFPYISVNITIATIMTILIYFTIENPDLGLINDLNLATKQAESANHAKSDFLSSMSHEIRTPLNAIIGFSQALAKEDISGKAREEVNDILVASNNLLEIVNGILDISKIEADKIEIINVDYSAKGLIDDVTSIINAKIGSKPIELKVDVDDQLPPVLFGDNNRLKQILLNLMTNSVKYTKEGYILLQVNCEKVDDSVKLTIKIEDSGIGMTEDDLNNLYTKFQRFDMDKNVNIAGTGLGMAITKGLIELMHGEIDVKSVYGEGTTFIIRMEQKISDKSINEIVVKDKTLDITPFDASGHRVLIVDDNKLNLKVAEKMFSEYNLELDLVGTGMECIEKIRSGEKYDLVFLDILMPKMKGPEVLEKLKRIPSFKVPVIALTADVISGMEDEYIEQGFDDCMSKPIIAEELYYVLKKYFKSTEVNFDNNVMQDSYNESLLESVGVNVKLGIDLTGNIDNYRSAVEDFYNNLEDKINLLFDFKISNDLEKYGSCAKELKNLANRIGYNSFANIVQDHEQAANEKNTEFIIKNYIKLKMESNKVKDLLKKYLGK